MMKEITVPPLPLTVSITRVGSRSLDGDNLQSACKAVRDQIADCIGTDDRSADYTWTYHQLHGAPAVEVEIKPRLT